MAGAGSDLEVLADEAAVRRLAACYTDAVNHDDPLRAASVYAEDGRLISFDGSEFAGRANLAEAFRATFAAFSFIHQVCHAGLVEVSGDRAVARWSVYEVNRKLEEDSLSIFFGTYEDEAVRLPEGWRFSRRQLRTTARARVETSQLKIPARETLSFDLGL